MADEEEVSTSSSVNLEYTFETIEGLARAYMDYVKKGGVFIPTEETHTMREEIHLSLRVPNTPEPIKVTGKIVWITPSTSKVMWVTPENTAGEARTPGIGIQFTSSNADAVSKKIERMIAQLDPQPDDSDTI